MGREGKEELIGCPSLQVINGDKGNGKGEEKGQINLWAGTMFRHGKGRQGRSGVG